MEQHRHTILVVDDEPDVVKSVQDLLRLDFNVLGATRAQDGLKLLEENDVHVVMTDQRMPDMTGVEFLKHVRSDFPEATRLLFTGYAELRAVIDAVNTGNIHRYITKPWDPEELQAIIREACERYDLIVDRRKLMAELKIKNSLLQSANAELQAGNDLKTAFIRVASHELRTPLTILTGLTDLAMRTPNAPPAMANLLGRMQQASVRLQHLMDQIVNMLVAGQFKHKVKQHDVDLTELLTAAVQDVQPFVELRHQNLVKKWEQPLGTVKVEGEKIRDSLNHLLLNAVKFTPDGGTITLSASRSTEGGTTIVVSDTGRGIEPEALPRICEPFFTGFDVDQHSSGVYEHGRKGIGLGMSVVKAFVEMHGGTLGILSAPEKGATITITLPPPG